MWYWINFLLRLMSRAGFSVMVLLWIASQWRVISFDWTKGGVQLLGMSRTEAFAVEWRTSANAPTYPYPVIPFNGPTITLDTFGITCWGSLTDGAIQMDYWLLCLLFLLATIATEWHRRRQARLQEPSAES